MMTFNVCLYVCSEKKHWWKRKYWQKSPAVSLSLFLSLFVCVCIEFSIQQSYGNENFFFLVSFLYVLYLKGIKRGLNYYHHNNHKFSIVTWYIFSAIHFFPEIIIFSMCWKIHWLIGKWWLIFVENVLIQNLVKSLQ